MTTFDASAQATEFPVTALRSLKQAMGDWFLIGALARDLVVNCAAGLPRGSETFDVDIAIAVDTDSEYRDRVAGLQQAGGSRIRYRTAGFPVDVIAYGGIAPENQFETDETTLDVTGMAEARACALEILLDDDLRVSCADLHAQVALKLVAWQVRGRTTTKDARDLGLLLAAGHNGIYRDRLWVDDDALEACDYVEDLAGAYRTGRLIARDFDPASLARCSRALSDDGIPRLADEAGRTAQERAINTERLHALRRGVTR